MTDAPAQSLAPLIADLQKANTLAEQTLIPAAEQALREGITTPYQTLHALLIAAYTVVRHYATDGEGVRQQKFADTAKCIAQLAEDAARPHLH